MKGRDPLFNFVFVGPFGRFIYSRYLLDNEPGDLLCYHRNSLMSFLLAWHQASLLRTIYRQNDQPSEEQVSLSRNIKKRLGSRDYRSQSLISFLEDDFIRRTLEEQEQGGQL